jgi:hypothetical protein
MREYFRFTRRRKEEPKRPLIRHHTVTIDSTTEFQAIQAKVEAERALRDLNEIKGQKAYVVILDDNGVKAQYAARDILEGQDSSPIKYRLAFKENGEDCIALYTAFRKAEIEATQSPHHVLIITDGNLTNPSQQDKIFKMGKDVGRELLKIAAENSWEPPYFIGNSANDWLNTELRETVTDRYLGEKKYRILQTLKDILR